MKKKVLITGASGNIGKYLSDEWKKYYQLCLIDESPSKDRKDIIRADVTDFDTLRDLSKGTFAIVHLAVSSDFSSSWEYLCAHIRGIYNICEVARINNVKRIVFASSNHTVGEYEPGILVKSNMPPRPDSLYGVQKCFGEILGRYYSDRHGLGFIAIRIGTFLKKPILPKHLITYLSCRDASQLFRLAIESEHVKYAVIFGTSDNTRKIWDISDAKLILGYTPQDNAEDYARELIEDVLKSPRVAVPKEEIPGKF